ncbi:MAG: NADH-quinone oxidoreductase subunit J [Alphaproteobacteria bacterium]|nr:NADH-quinone oxidoreductase subunit J [Alphaproteobacteria bacterium]
MTSLLVWSLAVPIGGALLAFVVGGRRVHWFALATLPIGLAIAIAIAAALSRSSGPLLYLIGGWSPPLGVALRADWLSAIMMVITAVVICGIAAFACGDFISPRPAEARRPFAFWILLLALWSALNLVFLSGDLFTLYVALELLVFSAVPLVCLDGRAETLRAALRYLLFALLGSVLYLVGTGLLYGACGTLDIDLLAACLRPEPVTLVAASLMTAGLLAKTALFPLYLWLPAAHAGAPPAASAVLSALVVKGSFFVAVRLWFFVMPALPGEAATQVMSALAAAAIVFASLLALRQDRLKLLVAYSTLAQIGYIFLMFALAFDEGSGRMVQGSALVGGMMQAISHATAKAGMFMAAGMIYASLGHDRISELGGIARAAPLAALTFLLAGLALIGPPSSGVYLAKTLLLRAADNTGQWWWAGVLQVGGVLTSAYLILVVAHALAPMRRAPTPGHAAIPRLQQAAALALVLCSLVLGLVPWQPWLPLPVAMSGHGPLGLAALWSMLWPILIGVPVAYLLGRRGNRRPWRVALWLEDADRLLRQWPTAGASLVAVAVALAAAMFFGR